MRGLLSRIFGDQAAPTPAQAAPVDSLTRCEREIAEAVSRRRAARLARPTRDEAKRFARARPKTDQLAREMAMAPVAC